VGKVTKLKYILIILGSAIVGIIIGWFIWGGGTLEIRLPEVTVIKTDTLYKKPDTLLINYYNIKYDTLRTIDSVFVVQYDTLYPYSLENVVYPLAIGKNLYLSPWFEYSFEYYYKNDTMIPTFYFPNMISEVVHKYGIDSTRVELKTIYVDYWYSNVYVQSALMGVSALAGFLLNDLSKTK
jgi:hypothetical protein